MWSLPPPLSSSFYLLPALFADACTLAGGAYFLQSGFEQRSCSTHEQATRLSPFQKSQGVSSVHPQPRQARSLLIRSSWATRIALAVFSPRTFANNNSAERSLESSRCPSTEPSRRAATRSWFSCTSFALPMIFLKSAALAAFGSRPNSQSTTEESPSLFMRFITTSRNSSAGIFAPTRPTIARTSWALAAAFFLPATCFLKPL